MDQDDIHHAHDLASPLSTVDSSNESTADDSHMPGDDPTIVPSTNFQPEDIEKVYPIRSVVTVGSPTVSTRRDMLQADGTTTPGGSGYENTIDRRIHIPSEPFSRVPVAQYPKATFDRLSMSSGGRTPADYFDIRRRRGSESDKSESSVTSSKRPVQQVVSVYENPSQERRGSTTTSKAGSIGVKSNTDRPAVDRNTASMETVNLLPYLTTRFKHVVTNEGHAIITGRDGDTPQRCEDEPIHMPGAVQGFGVLIAMHETEGRLVVHVVSENSKRITQYTPAQLFALQTFTDIMPDDQADVFLDHLDFIKDEETDPAQEGPEVFSLSLRNPHYDSKIHRRHERVIKMWCAIHIANKANGTIVCELEMEDDQLHPVAPPGEETPEPPEDTLNSNPTAEELLESTTSFSKPLRVLRHARKRKGDGAAMEVFNIMSQLQEQLASATSLERFLSVLVGIVKQLTGFHRVMVYQFDESFNGRVVTELVDPRATKDLYKGLHFPASDIPKQARDLYRINKVRLLYDREQETARLCCRTPEDLAEPLDLTHSYLRAMSPIHIKYLANMSVRASMSISITVFNELWGLISCHSYGNRGMRVTFPVRKMCRIVGDIASRNIERLSYASRLQARKLINTIPTEANPSGYIVASSDDLLNLFDADFGVLSIRDETKVLGKLPNSQEALAMVEYLRLRGLKSVFTSQEVTKDFPDLIYPPGFTTLAGLLLVPLSASGEDFIAFFRKAQLRQVKWAGNPYEKMIKQGTEGFLEPRKSFKVWSETVANKCRDWTEEQVETAAVLCLVYGKFIEVWRQKEAALQNSQLTRLLLANASHEVRTPLNAIINYLEIAMEGALDSDTRENLSKSHSASKSLIYVINDLLDLTRAEGGNELVKEEPFDFHLTLKETADTFRGDAERKNLKYEVVQHQGVPQILTGDPRRVRQAISNLAANAIQHTEHGTIKIEVWTASLQEGHCELGIAIQDTGKGMSPAKLDLLFQELEQVQIEDDANSKALESSEAVDSFGNPQKKALGLGLAIVARIVRNMNGQLRLKSEEGKGSRFIIQLPFGVPEDRQAQDAAQLLRMQSDPTSPNLQVDDDGEVTLVSGSVLSTRTSRPDMVKRSSHDSLGSLNSRTSALSAGSAKSEADRLIDAIQSSPLTSKDNLPRRNSAGSGAAPKLRSALQVASRPGDYMVTDEKTPLRPVRMTAEDEPSGIISPASFGMSSPLQSPAVLPGLLQLPKFSVLVAEDDPINSRIMMKRLQTKGHSVKPTANGEECANVFANDPKKFDIVLMDMQMPIVDGLEATKRIRQHESTLDHTSLSQFARLIGRVPIFAVSASLVELHKDRYMKAGFDGWILKPVDFARLENLMQGVVDNRKRNDAVHVRGEWERGGWFAAKESD